MLHHWWTRLPAVLLAAAILAPAPASAQATSPIRLKLRTIDIVVQADGTNAATQHDEIQIMNAAVIAQASQTSIQYDALTQEVTVLKAYTLKPDGTQLAVGADAIMTQQAPGGGSAMAPVYTDSKRKILIFPNVQVGDTLVSDFVITTRTPYFPGQFSRAFQFVPSAVIDDQRITIRVPKSMPLTLEAKNVTQAMAAEGDQLVYTFGFSRTAPAAPITGPLNEPWLRDRLFVSTLKSFDEVAHAYAKMALPHMRVTPRIQAQADEITKGITDKKLQAKALYEWVGRRVRYVAIELGVGGYIPHDSEWTLNNSYGDCKDQAILLSALLAAKNIKAFPVMIYAGQQYQLSDTPTPYQFNHVITYLPDYKIYADTTPGNIAFGELPLALYGKPVLHTVATGPSRFSTPLLPPDLLTSEFKANAKIDAEGRVTVTSTTKLTGPWAANWRRVAEQMTAGSTVRAAEQLLRAKNLTDATGDFTFAAPDSNGPYAMDSRLQIPKAAPQSNLMTALTALRTVQPAGDTLIGSLGNRTAKPTDSTACYSGRQREDITLELPPGRALAKLPANASIKGKGFSYESRWAQQGQTVTLQREFTAALKEPICAGALRLETAAALTQIRQDQEQPLMLAE